jgi:hypothetical protein
MVCVHCGLGEGQPRTLQEALPSTLVARLVGTLVQPSLSPSQKLAVFIPQDCEPGSCQPTWRKAPSKLARSVGGSPTQVRPSRRPGSECCVSRRRRRPRSVHSGCVGCVIEPRNGHIAGAEAVSMVERHTSSTVMRGTARPAGVGEHITRERIVSELGISRVRPKQTCCGPHREGEEP